ncbi:MAG TPA: hypothetical protein VFR12_03085 [Pyrinomonadaceae bacterium]|nr:hypothetical protein [Pyrinomonadaceae bacterium]
MADIRDTEILFRPLHESPIVSVHDYCCHMNTSKCPVCDWAINDGGIKVTVAGKEITVCCDECVEKAKENPAQYAGAE